MNGNKVLFVLLFVLTVENIFYIVEGKVSCDCGYNFITKQFPVKFTVAELSVEYDCLTEEFENGDAVWPGPPRNLNVSTSYTNFSLSWKPPDDSSVQHVTGFLLKLFVEDFQPVFSMDPDACYFVNFTHTRVLATIPYGYVLQDSIVSVQCHVTQLPPLNVRIYLTSLPLPSVYRHYKEITDTINFEDNSQIERTTSEQKPTLEENVDDVDNLDDISAKESSILAVCVIVVSSSFIVTIIFTVHKTLKHYNKDDSVNNQQKREVDPEHNKESLVDTKPTNNIDRTTNIKQESVQQDLLHVQSKKQTETILVHDAFEEFADKCYVNKAGSLPEKYRNIIMDFNFES